MGNTFTKCLCSTSQDISANAPEHYGSKPESKADSNEGTSDISWGEQVDKQLPKRTTIERKISSDADFTQRKEASNLPSKDKRDFRDSTRKFMKSSRDLSDMMLAARKGDYTFLKTLIKLGADVNEIDEEGNTPLMIAAKFGKYNCIGILLKAGANFHQCNNEGDTALMLAIVNDSKLCVRALLGFQNHMNQTLLSKMLLWVAENGYVNYIKHFVGADVNVRNDQGETALTLAVKKRHNNCVNVLLEAGARIDYDTVVRALETNHTTTMQLLSKAMTVADRVDILLPLAAEGNVTGTHSFIKSWVSVDETSNTGETALMKAAELGYADIVHLLVKSGAGVNHQDRNGDTPLIRAAKHLKCLKVLINNGADVNLENHKKVTALMETAAKGCAKCVNLLLKAGAEVNALSSEGNTALIRAIIAGNYGTFQELLRTGADVNATGNASPIYWSVAYRRFNIAEELVKVGADVNITCVPGMLPLIKAAENNDNHFVEYLLNSGANVNVEPGFTSALMWAAENINVKMAELLIQKGANVNSTNAENETALFKAVSMNHGPCIELLLGAGAHVNIDPVHTTFLISAVKHGNNNVLDVLIQRGANVNGTNSKNETALFQAVASNQVRCVESLCKTGADVNIRPVETTALNWAVKNSNAFVLDLLIQNGAHVNAVDENNETALFRAAFANQTPCIKLLCKSGADVNIRPDHSTALIAAVKNRNVDVVELLIAKGANLDATDNRNETALLEAVSSDLLNSVKSLCEAGADVNIGSMKLTPLIKAIDRSQRSTMELLIQKGADVNATDLCEGAALLRAVAKVEPSYVELLCRAGADVNLRNAGGLSATQYALCQYYRGPNKSKVYQCLRSLILVGADVNRNDFSECVQFRTKLRLSLQFLCRETIRNHLMSADTRSNLFVKVPKTGLPTALQEYVLSSFT